MNNTNATFAGSQGSADKNAGSPLDTGIQNPVFVKSTRNRQCLLCGNISGHCKTQQGQQSETLIYCHNHPDNPRRPIHGYTWIKTVSQWGLYGPVRTQTAKTAQPQATRHWVYCDAAGDPLIRVNRTDDGNGNKRIWQECQVDGIWTTKAPAKIKAQAKAAVMPYRYLDALKASAEGQRVFWVEGEKCADALWELGLAATTSIGGSDGYSRYGDCSELFQGVDLVICPDRDQSGIKYANAIATDYPQAQWLYAFPDSPEWDNLPKSGGLDIVDWIASGADKATIEAAVVTRRVIESPANNVVSMRNKTPIAPLESLDTEIEALLDQNLPSTKLQAAKIRLRQSASLTERDFDRLWEAVESKYEGGSEFDPDEIRRLLKSKYSRLSLAQVLPPTFAQPLAEQAATMALREEVYLTSILTVVGTLAQNGTNLLLNRSTSYEVTPNLYAAIVAPPSQRKSPVISMVATKPLRILEREAKVRYKKAHADWEAAKAAEDGEPFTDPEPQLPIHYFTKASGESILQQAQRVPERGLLNLSDELAGSFRSANLYRGGRGSDSEDMLSYYDGVGGKTLRVDGVRNDVECLNYGVLGGIQPRVLENFLGNCQDDNGNWARYIFVNQPVTAATWRDEGIPDLPDLLAIYYQAIADYPAVQYEPSPQAKARFGALYNDYEQRRIIESNPALQAMLGKSAGRVGKVALVLHLMEAAAAGKAQPDLEVSVDTIERAALVAEFAIEQIRAIYADSNGEGTQSPIIARIIELSQRKGFVSARDVFQCLPKSNRPTTAAIRQLFAKLVDQGFGVIEGEGKSVRFVAQDIQSIEVEQTQPGWVQEIEPGDEAYLSPEAATYTEWAIDESVTIQSRQYDPDEGRYYFVVQNFQQTATTSVWAHHLKSGSPETYEFEYTAEVA